MVKNSIGSKKVKRPQPAIEASTNHSGTPGENSGTNVLMLTGAILCAHARDMLLEGDPDSVDTVGVVRIASPRTEQIRVGKKEIRRPVSLYIGR